MSDSYNPMDCSLPGSSIHGNLQARVLEWGVIALSEGSLDKYYCNIKGTQWNEIKIILNGRHLGYSRFRDMPFGVPLI